MSDLCPSIANHLQKEEPRPERLHNPEMSLSSEKKRIDTQNITTTDHRGRVAGKTVADIHQPRTTAAVPARMKGLNFWYLASLSLRFFSSSISTCNSPVSFSYATGMTSFFSPDNDSVDRDACRTIGPWSVIRVSPAGTFFEDKSSFNICRVVCRRTNTWLNLRQEGSRARPEWLRGRRIAKHLSLSSDHTKQHYYRFREDTVAGLSVIVPSSPCGNNLSRAVQVRFSVGIFNRVSWFYRHKCKLFLPQREYLVIVHLFRMLIL